MHPQVVYWHVQMRTARSPISVIFFSSHVDWYRRGSKEVNDLAPSKNNDLPKKNVAWLVWNMFIIFYFSISWECHHPNWHYDIFFRGVGQPPTSSNTSNIFQCIQAKLEIDLALAKMFGFSQAPSRVPPCWGHLPTVFLREIRGLGFSHCWGPLLHSTIVYTAIYDKTCYNIYIYCNKCQFTQWYW